MMKKIRQFIGIMLLATLVTGCLPFLDKIKQRILMAPPEERFVKKSLQKGKEFEHRGDLMAALKQYKLAMTVEPSNQEAIKNRKRVEKALRYKAARYYRTGLKLHQQGKYGRARKQFLMALSLRPTYPEVIHMLSSRERIPIKRYIVHKIKAGESLSRLAMMYYGDQHKFPIIAKYNDITDATNVQVGQEVKVPEIEGVKFLVQKKAVEAEEVEVAYSGFWDWEEYASEFQIEMGPEASAQGAMEEPADQISIYRDYGVDLFNQSKYEEAIIALNQVLKVHPEDEVALEYTYKSHFQRGIALFEHKDYLKAKGEFEASLHFRRDCAECNAYMKKSEDLYKEIHYRKGIQYFGKEELIKAIEEWQLVWTLDRHYRRVEYLIKKAKTILKNIEKLKESLKD